VLQVDGYAGFKRLAGDLTDGSVTLAFCWAHMRRPFYEFFTSTKSPLAAEVLARIREVYAIEADIRGQPADYRRTIRQDRSRPIVDALHVWLHDRAGRVSAASDLAKAIRYAMRRGTHDALDAQAEPTNFAALQVFRDHVRDLWQRSLRRRSQRALTNMSG
jgi:transposase